MKWSRTCSSLSWTFCFLQKMQPLLVHHMAAILCQQHHTTVLQKRNGEQVLCLKLKRDLSHKSLQHIIRQTGGQAGYHHSTAMGTLMGKGQGFDLMPKQSASYSLHNAVRQTTPFCWKTINLMLWSKIFCYEAPLYLEPLTLVYPGVQALIISVLEAHLGG